MSGEAPSTTTTNNLGDICFYIPVHGNFSQVEHSACFITSTKQSRIFVYSCQSFNTEEKKMIDFYTTSPEWSAYGLKVAQFSIQNILKAIREDESKGLKIVFVLTSSTNYGFGRSQRQLLQIVQSLHPSSILDVFSSGHCMFGCESCGLSEHSLPLFFTRYHNGKLPYNSSFIKSHYFGDNSKKRILLCPSVGDTSWLGRTDILREIEKLVKELEPKGITFIAKFHGFCYLDETQGKPHALFGLSDSDRHGVAFLKELLGSGKVAEEKHYNILPFLEASDIIITDVNSSLPFESLHFPNLCIIAHEDAETRKQDQNYVELLNTFATPLELRQLILSACSGEETLVHRSGLKGQEFFKSKYGEVKGDEVQRAAILRKWFNPTKANDLSLEQQKEISSLSIEAEESVIIKKLNEEISDPGPLDFLSRGLEIPPEVAEYVVFVGTNSEQLKSRNVPECLWKKLFNKVNNDQLDAGNVFSFARLPSNGKLVLACSNENGLDELSDIFLIDHAWSTTLQTSYEQLKTIPGLIDRIEQILQVADAEIQETTAISAPETTTTTSLASEEEEKNKRVDRVWNEMWRINETYRIAGPDGQATVWYIMDEVGSRIMHNPEANVKCVPFIYAKTGVAYSLIWPIERIEAGEAITRDYIDSCEDPLQRSVKLIAFGDFTSEIEPILEDALKRKIKEREEIDNKTSMNKPNPPPQEPHSEPRVEVLLTKKPQIIVRTDTQIVLEYLKRNEFKVMPINDEEEAANEAEKIFGKADILFYLNSEFSNEDYQELHGSGRFVNQLPGERCVCFKNELALTIRSIFGQVNWLPETFNLETEMVEFVARFKERQENGKDNHWIVKPWNEARGQGIIISNQLQVILRQVDAGPVIASKYIEKPATLAGRKFDLRFLVYARSKEGWNQPEFSVYNTFWIRFANKQYTLKDLHDYETHFTVMNYRPGSQMTHMKDFQFIKAFEEEKKVKWETVRNEANKIMGLLFQAAIKANNGIQSNANAVAIYGIDMLLTEDLHPVIEECNFSPDCTRACKYNAEFYNETFGYLFLGETEHVTRIL